MNRKGLEEITLKDLYEVVGGDSSANGNMVETLNNIYTAIIKYFNS